MLRHACVALGNGGAQHRFEIALRKGREFARPLVESDDRNGRADEEDMSGEKDDVLRKEAGHSY
jgi:hypothetical protein